MGKYRTQRVFACMVLLALSFTSCSGNSGDTDFPFSNSAVYFKKTKSVTVEVYYETGSEPFVGTRFNGKPLWSILEENLNSIFQYRSQIVDINIPTELNEMNQISPTGTSSWSTTAILNLHKENTLSLSSETSSIFYVYFVNGYAESGSSTIGFSVNGTPVVVIFKDVIRGLGGTPTQKFAEQSTLVHELGHALGLVNNGIPLASLYQDEEHGSHSINQDSVMYWLNEGKSDLVNFVQKFISSGSVEMWGPEELNDVREFSE